MNAEQKLQRLFSKISYDHGCWNWNGTVDKDGYALAPTSINGATRVQRILYQLEFGKLSPSDVTDHLCRNHACVNPMHLEAVPQRENILRGNTPAGVNARRTHCIHGHELTDDNVIIRIKEGGKRRCRTCHNSRLTGEGKGCPGKPKKRKVNRGLV